MVRVINVPRMAELSVKSLINAAREDPDISQYLPAISEKKVINREYLFNIINSVKPDFFKANIRAIIAQKKEDLALKQQKYINVTDSIYQIIQNT